MESSKQVMSLIVIYAPELQHRHVTASHFGSNISLPSYISSLDSFEGWLDICDWQAGRDKLTCVLPSKSFYFIIDLSVQALTCLPKGMIQPIIVTKLMSRDRYYPIQSIPRISRLSYYWLTCYHPFTPSLFIHHKGIRKNQELSFRAISLCDRVCTYEVADHKKIKIHA